MKKIIVLALVVMGLAVTGLAYAGPLSVASHSNVAMSDVVIAGDSGVPVQFAQYQGHRCYCCWRSYHGGWKCKWMKRWKCRDRGGWCRW